MNGLPANAAYFSNIFFTFVIRKGTANSKKPYPNYKHSRQTEQLSIDQPIDNTLLVLKLYVVLLAVL